MTDIRTIENWIDVLNAIWAFDDGHGRTVKTPHCSDKNEFPESLNLGDGPVALSWPDTVTAKYGAASSSIPTILIWHGTTELHLTPDVNKTNLAYILPFFGRILNAAKANIKLGSLVAEFHLEEENAMSLDVLKYGSEVPHHAITIHWTIKQDLSGQI
jgi:hypothetical protein